MIISRHYIYSFIGILVFFSSSAIAQVPVREEPRHRLALQNKYIRVLDVWIPPGDTSLFHIHATPSVFVVLSGATMSSQVKGEGWVTENTETGKTWFRSFTPDILVHRVCNPDKTPFHVNDIEILSSYNSNSKTSIQPLSFPLLFENEKAFAYHLTGKTFSRQVVRDRGPIIAELVSGKGLIFHDLKADRSTEIKTGKYMYIEPESSFYFSTGGAGEINLILFEIK